MALQNETRDSLHSHNLLLLLKNIIPNKIYAARFVALEKLKRDERESVLRWWIPEIYYCPCVHMCIFRGQSAQIRINAYIKCAFDMLNELLIHGSSASIIMLLKRIFFCSQQQRSCNVDRRWPSPPSSFQHSVDRNRFPQVN